MKIVYIAAGAGGMYCGSCLHDNTLAAALSAAGDDALLVPLYTPLRTDEPSVSQRRIFFGGLNVFLQERFSLARRTPWFFDRLLDRPGLLRWLGNRGSTVDPAVLGALTVSMLQGRNGRQRKELDKLVEWLAHDVRPDIVHLSNALLLGMAGEIGRRLNVPVVCTLSGEDIFLDKLPEPYRSQADDELRRAAADVSVFVALNAYYARSFAQRLSLPADRVRVIPHGLRLEGYREKPPTLRGQRLRIGYFARVCHDKGLHQLVAAAGRLAAESGLPEFEVVAAGYLADADRPYLQEVERQARQLGLGERFRYAGEVDRPEKLDLLRSFDVVSLPTVYQESKGLSVLEAWAAGVPAVLPEHGAFPEMVSETGGGLLHEPGSDEALAAALRRMLIEPELRESCGRDAAQAIRRRYTADEMARRTHTLYAELLDGRQPQPRPQTT